MIASITSQPYACHCKNSSLECNIKYQVINYVNTNLDCFVSKTNNFEPLFQLGIWFKFTDIISVRTFAFAYNLPTEQFDQFALLKNECKMIIW